MDRGSERLQAQRTSHGKGAEEPFAPVSACPSDMTKLSNKPMGFSSEAASAPRESADIVATLALCETNAGAQVLLGALEVIVEDIVVSNRESDDKPRRGTAP